MFTFFQFCIFYIYSRVSLLLVHTSINLMDFFPQKLFPFCIFQVEDAVVLALAQHRCPSLIHQSGEVFTFKLFEQLHFQLKYFEEY